MSLTIGYATATAQNAEQPDRGIDGVWRLTFTPHNCLTGTPIPTAVFEALFTFHKDGTMSVWSHNNVITLTRSPSHGLWRRGQGWNEYSTKFINLHYNLATGAYQGRQEAKGSFALSASGNDLTSTNSTTVFDANGNAFAFGCSTSIGTRFELEP